MCNFFVSLVGRQIKGNKRFRGIKNAQYTLLRTLRPEAAALHGFIFFNILARQISYYIIYIEGKMYAQRLPLNGHVNFICFLRAHKSKKIVFLRKICALPLSMAGHFMFNAVGDPFLQAF